MTKALVTGFTGCIGAATVSYLFERGVDEIVGLSRHADLSRIAPKVRDRIKVTRGDIANEAQVSAITAAPPNDLFVAAGDQIYYEQLGQ